jgi:hypothetical protein
MTPDELRAKIARDQPQTLCYCSSREGADRRPLALCSDCQGWLAEHSARIEAGWRWYVNHLGHLPARQLSADSAELNHLGVYMARRFYQ